MLFFGITVKAKDIIGEFYVNHTVYAPDLDFADQLVIQYYQQSEEELIELDQAVQLEDIHAEGVPRILETQGKIYFGSKPAIDSSNKTQKMYQVTFEGTGYDLLTENNQKIGGFFVSVVASAVELDLAFDIAYEKLSNSQAYQDLVSSNEHPNAVLSIDNCIEIACDDLNVPEISEFVFYPPEEQTEDSKGVGVI